MRHYPLETTRCFLATRRILKLARRLILAVPILVCFPVQSVTPERNHYPQQASGFTGWQVSQDRGTLGIVIPAATLPGDIPVPVVFRFNATFAQLRGGIWIAGLDRNGNDIWKTSNTYMDQSIEGTVHFGMILPQPGWSSDGVPGAPEGGKSLWSWVLEDGSQYTAQDFSTPQTLSSSLFTAFQLGVKTTAVNIDSTGTVAFYPASAADLGHWSPQVAALTAGANFTGTGGPTGYYVVMDRDKARIFAFDYQACGWVPVLWVNRFNQYVQFTWTIGTASAPFTNYRTVTVLNSRSPATGFRLQTVAATVQSPEPLIRVDFIGIQAPSLQVTGYSGLASQEPASLGGGTSNDWMQRACGNVVRPTEVRLGQPGTSTLVTPTWSQPVPGPYGSESWLPDRVWSFDYLDAQCAELRHLTDPFGLSTVFSWTTQNLYSKAWTTNNVYRCVNQATSTDSANGITRTTTYTQSLPSTSNSPWSTTESTVWTGSPVIGASTPPNTTTRSYAPPSDQNYNNAALSSVSVSNGSTPLSTTIITLPEGTMYGADGTLSYGGQARATNFDPRHVITSSTLSFPAGDTPNKAVSANVDYVTARPNSITTTIAGITDTVTYTYDPNGTAANLDPKRLVAIDHTRTGGPSGSPTAAPTQVKTFDPASFLPTASYLQDSAGNKMGQNMTWDAAGHLVKVQDFASGSLFNTALGSSTSQWTVDANTGLPTNLTVSYYDPDSGFTDHFSKTWPLASYDTADRPQSATGARGVTTNTTYYADGRVATLAREGDAPITYAYPDERTVTATQNGLTTTMTMDGFGRLISRIRGADGVTETYSFDGNGQGVKVVETSTKGSKRTTQKAFDARGRLTSTTPPVGPTLGYTYALATGTYAGHQAVTVSYSGQTFTSLQVLDPWGHALSATDPMGIVKTAAYDVMGHATSTTITPPGNGSAQTRTFIYNALGLLTSKTEPETGTITFSSTFDIHGLPLTVTENGSRVRNLKFDGLGRLRDQSGGNITEAFNYNGPFLSGTSRTVGSDWVNQAFTYNGPGARLSAETTNGAVTGAW